MPDKIRVVLTTEGTYPYYTGGVSTWADILVRQLADVNFYLLPIMMHPYISLKFELPSNVLDVINVPLWGTEEPTEYISELAFHKIYAQKLKTTEAVVRDEFIQTISTIVHAIYDGNTDLDRIGESLCHFHDFFGEYDYHRVFRSRTTWDFFYEKMLGLYKDQDERPTVYEIVENLRWLYRFFVSLLSPLREADIYHSSAAAFCGLPCIVAKLRKGARFLLTEHGIYVREQYLYASRERMSVLNKEFLMGLIKLVSRLNYHFADQVSPVCAHNKRWERRFGTAEEKIKVIYNGIDTERFRKITVAREGRPTVVMIARIDHLKDVETFIRTCDVVRRSVPRVLFKLYGPVIDEKYYKRCRALMEDLKLDDNFVFAGMTLTPEIANNEGDVVMLTSISEAFPFAVLEGMASEKVVIASDVGGTKEVLEGYGYIVKPRDDRALAEKVIQVLGDPAGSAELGIAARQRVLNGFRIEDMVRNYTNTYIALAGKNGN